MDIQFNGFWQGLHQFVSSTNETKNSFITRVQEVFGREMTLENLVTEIYQMVIQEQYFEPKQKQEMQTLIRQLQQLTLPQQLQERIGVISARLEIFPPEKRKQQERADCNLDLDEEMFSQNSKKPKCSEQCPIILENRDVEDLLKKIDLLKVSLDAEELDSTITEHLQFAKDYDVEFGLQSKIQKILNDSLIEAIDQPEIFARRVNLIKNDLIECDLHATRCSNENLKALRKLTSLKKLNLSECHKITNEGISYLQDLPLVSLNLSECKKIKEDALQYLLKMPLEELILFEFDKWEPMKITNVGINWLQKFPKLKSLALQTNMQSLENLAMPQLQRLNISLVCMNVNYQVLRKLPLNKLRLNTVETLGEELLNFQEMSLELLNLRCNVTDKGLQFLKNMKKIETIYLALNDEVNTDEGLKCLKEIPFLKGLDFSDYKMTKETFEYIQGIPLEELLFHSYIDSNLNCFGDDELKFLQGMPLKTLVFAPSENFSDRSFEYLKDFPLEKLEIYSKGSKITGSGFQHLQNMPLKKLTFLLLKSLKMENLVHLEKLTTLKILELHYCKLEKGLQFLQNLSLEELNILGCNEIDNQDLEYIKKRSLKCLMLSDCYGLKDEQLKDLPMTLTSLNLDGCELITDKTLKHLQGRPLRSLDLSFTQISDEGLKLLQAFPLEAVNLYECNKITNSGIEYLKNLNIEVHQNP